MVNELVYHLNMIGIWHKAFNNCIYTYILLNESTYLSRWQTTILEKWDR